LQDFDHLLLVQRITAVDTKRLREVQTVYLNLYGSTM